MSVPAVEQVITAMHVLQVSPHTMAAMDQKVFAYIHLHWLKLTACGMHALSHTCHGLSLSMCDT